jgi:hypothetical protein
METAECREVMRAFEMAMYERVEAEGPRDQVRMVSWSSNHNQLPIRKNGAQ